MSIERAFEELKTNVNVFKQEDLEWVLLIEILEKLIKNDSRNLIDGDNLHTLKSI
jgi:hypothetical protein